MGPFQVLGILRGYGVAYYGKDLNYQTWMNAMTVTNLKLITLLPYEYITFRYSVNDSVAQEGSSPSSGKCGDGVCAMEEGSESCATDCANKELATTFDFSLGSSGSMFSIKALRDLSVSSIVVNAMSRGEGRVKVYTRPGSYSGHELNSDGWELIYNNPTLEHNRRGKQTELGNFDNAVVISSGSTQSFFITSTKGLVYQAGTTEGAEYANDESMVVYEGVGTTDEFAGAIYGPRVFGGIVR